MLLCLPGFQLHGRPSSHTIMGDGPRGTPVGLHSTLFWGSATCDALVNPANLQSSMALSPLWSFRPVVVVRSFAARGGALRSDRVASLASGPPRVATCRPALATARTVWQWHSGGEREGACKTEGHSVATLHIHTTGHWPQLLSHFTAPAHPPCSARSLPGTVGVICVTDNRLLCARHRDSDCSHSGTSSILQTTPARTGAPAGGPAAMRWPRCANRMRDRTDVGADRAKLDLESDAPPAHRHGARRHAWDILILYSHTEQTRESY